MEVQGTTFADLPSSIASTIVIGGVCYLLLVIMFLFYGSFIAGDDVKQKTCQFNDKLTYHNIGFLWVLFTCQPL